MMQKNYYTLDVSFFIMCEEFVDRDVELRYLERKWEEEGAQLIVLYGRRGKKTFDNYMELKFFLEAIYIRKCKVCTGI